MESVREQGRRLLGETLGAEYLQRRDESTTAFNAPLRKFSETAAFGMIRSRPGLEPKVRSMLCLAMLTALNRPHELELHLTSAVNNGCTVEEIREPLMHVAPVKRTCSVWRAGNSRHRGNIVCHRSHVHKRYPRNSIAYGPVLRNPGDCGLDQGRGTGSDRKGLAAGGG